MNFKKTTLILALPFLIFSCGDSPENTSTDDSTSGSEKSAPSLAIIESPCELISSEDVASICNVASEFKIVQEDKKLTYPTCIFKWEDGVVKRSMEIGGTTVDFDMPSEVLIVMVKNANEQMFGQATSVYKDGVDANIGDKSIWGVKMSQLTFLAKGYIFHVHVKMSNEDEVNKKHALKIAKKLIGQL